MAKKSSAREKTLEIFVVTIDDWYRHYSFGINPFPRIIEIGTHIEGDRISIAGRIKSKTKRKYDTAQLDLSPLRNPEPALRQEADAIGSVWGKKGRLMCFSNIPADAYHSLVATLSTDMYAEILISVHNMWRGKGLLTDFHFERDSTDYENDTNPNLSDDPVRVRLRL